MENSPSRRGGTFLTLLSFLSLLLPLTVTAAAQDTAKRTEARTRMQAALKALQIPNADQAKGEADLIAATTIDPTFATPWYNLAMVQEEQKRLPAAVASLEKCLQIDPTGPLAVETKLHLSLLRTEVKGGGPTVEDRRIALIVAMRDAGQLADATVAAEQALTKMADSWRLNSLYGDLLASGEEFAKAQTAFQTAMRTAPAAFKPRLEQQAQRAAFFAYARQEEVAATKANEDKAPDVLDRLYHAWQLNPKSVGLSLMTAGAAVAKSNALIALEVTTELARTGPVGLRAQAVKMIASVRNLQHLAEQLKTGPQVKTKADGVPEIAELQEEGSEDEAAAAVQRDLPKQSSENALAEARGSLEVSQQREREAKEMEARWTRVGQEISTRSGDPAFANTQIAAYRSIASAEKRHQAYLRLVVAYNSQ